MATIEDFFAEGELKTVFPSLIRAELGTDRDEIYVKVYVSELTERNEYGGYEIEQILESEDSDSGTDDEEEPTKEEEEKETIEEKEESSDDEEEPQMPTRPCCSYKTIVIIGMAIVVPAYLSAFAYILKHGK